MSEQAQPVALVAGHFPPAQARELRPLSTDESPFAPLPGGPGIVASQDRKLRKFVEVTAALACVYMVGICAAHVVGVAVIGEIFKGKLKDLAHFPNQETLMALPGWLMSYMVPSLLIQAIVGSLFIFCACCATRARESCCAFCFCCCSAWHSCTLCLVLLSSLPTIQFLVATSGVVQDYFDSCDPSLCLQNTTDWPSNGQEDTRRAVDCFAHHVWDNEYRPAYPKAEDLPISWSTCDLFLDCNYDLVVPNDRFQCSSDANENLLKWQDGNATYFLASRGASCPCDSKYILDWEECQRAMESFPSTWNATRTRGAAEPSTQRVRACFVRETKVKGHFFEFASVNCDPGGRRGLEFVCAAAPPKASFDAAAAMRQSCTAEVEGEESPPNKDTRARLDQRQVPRARPPFAITMPQEPLRSCGVNNDTLQLWRSVKEEAHGVLLAIQAMNLIRIALFIPGVVLFGLAFWWGQLLWKQVSQPEVIMVQQPLLPTTMVWPQEMQPVHQPLVVSGEQQAGNAPAVPGNDGV